MTTYGTSEPHHKEYGYPNVIIPLIEIRREKFIDFVSKHPVAVTPFQRYSTPDTDDAWEACLEDYKRHFQVEYIDAPKIRTKVKGFKKEIRKRVRDHTSDTFLIRRWEWKLANLLGLLKDHTFWTNSSGNIVKIEYPEELNLRRVEQEPQQPYSTKRNSSHFEIVNVKEEYHIEDAPTSGDNAIFTTISLSDDEPSPKSRRSTSSSNSNTENEKPFGQNPMESAVLRDIAKDPNRHFLCELGIQLQMLPRIQQMELKVMLQQKVLNQIVASGFDEDNNKTDMF